MAPQLARVGPPGYSPGRVNTPRYAQCATAVAVSLGLAIMPVSAVSAAPSGDDPAEAAPDSTDAETPTDAEADVGDVAEEGATDPAAPSDGDAPADDAAAAGDSPATPTDASAPAESPAEEPLAEEPAAAEPVAEEPAPTEAETPEAEVITVRPRAATTAVDGKAIAPTGSSEVLEDERRHRADERLLLRASYLSFGVAGIAGITTAVAAQRAHSAARQLDELDATEDRSTLERRESSMLTLTYVAGAVAGVQLLTGVVLLGVGLRKTKTRRHAVAPSVGRGHVGLTWRARF